MVIERDIREHRIDYNNALAAASAPAAAPPRMGQGYYPGAAGGMMYGGGMAMGGYRGRTDAPAVVDMDQLKDQIDSKGAELQRVKVGSEGGEALTAAGVWQASGEAGRVKPLKDRQGRVGHAV